MRRLSSGVITVLAVPVVLAALLSSCMSGPVVPGDAVMLGERTVAFKANHNIIQVGRYEGFFRSLFFVVEKNDIQIYNLVITYGNGERERIDTRLNFNADSRSRALTFHGGKRRIRTIAFTYRTAGEWADGRARVVVYGVK
jgi:hypothetical protein